MKYVSWIVIIAVVAAIVAGMVMYSSQPGRYDGFATCIKNSGATFFGAFWCPHCQEEKSYFGKSTEKLPYVECSTADGQGQTEICKQNNIESYPTWQLKDGTRKTGTLTLQELSDFTGCPLVTGAAVPSPISRASATSTASTTTSASTSSAR